MDSLRLSYALPAYGGESMPVVTAVDAASVGRATLNALMADYLALERARVYRRLVVRRFSLLAFVFAVIGFGFRWLPQFASWFSVGLCTAVSVWAGIVELRCDRRLTRRLDGLPDSAALRRATDRKKVIKSS